MSVNFTVSANGKHKLKEFKKNGLNAELYERAGGKR
jgi:hypothetical protein